MTRTPSRLVVPILVAVAALVAACTPAPTPTPTAVPAGAQDEWRATAAEHRGANGEQFEYNCPPGGTAGTVWGVDLYTDDSSVCTAAVHAGAITFEEGGTVTIEIRPGEGSYEGSERNGVTSATWGLWNGSFVIVEPGG